MPHPLDDGPADALLARVAAAAGPYLDSLADRPALDVAKQSLLDDLKGPLPDEGEGADAVIERLLAIGTAAAPASSGPRYFNFVQGGSTPAATAADWTATLLDQNAITRVSSPFATQVETVVIDWLRDLVGLPEGWGGALVGSGMLANFTALGCATAWWGERQGFDTVREGLSGLRRMAVLSSGYVHASTRKALQMLGHGRDVVRVCALDGTGEADIELMRKRLTALDGVPAVLIANCGEIDAGRSDPLEAFADLAAEYDAWLHVDGVIGAFAGLSPRTEHVVRGLDRADSIGSDAHKWLNVPYESGFALLREPARLASAFGMPGAAYTENPQEPDGGYGMLGPESSRRARALPLWATLAAYGRSGYRQIVEHSLDRARQLGDLVREAPDLELLAPVELCVVCFRATPAGVRAEDLNDLNRALGAALLADGRFAAGLTTFDGKVALRPALVNWRTRPSDVSLFVDVVRSLLADL